MDIDNEDYDHVFLPLEKGSTGCLPYYPYGVRPAVNLLSDALVPDGFSVKLNNYTVVFKGYGGIPAFQEVEVTHGDTVDPLPTVSLAGYTFMEWNTEYNGSGTTFTASTPVTAEMTVYAIWGGTVTFNGNGGTLTSQEEIVKYGNPMDALPTVSRVEHTFMGWNTEQDGSGSTFTGSTPVTADITVYAIWEPSSCNVTFNGNGGTPTTQEETLDYGDTIDALPTVSRVGHTFIEWNTEQDGSGTAFTASTPVTTDITVYAIWEVHSYTLSFNIGAGSGSITVVLNEEEITSGDLVPYGSTVIFTATPAQGWNFNRWDIDDTTVNTPVFDLIVDSDKTVTAYFARASSSSGSSGSSGSAGSVSKAEYTLTIEIEGQGTNTPEEGEHKYPAGTSVTLKAAAVEGWEFAQWIINKEAVSNMETEIKLNGNVQAKAVFKETQPKSPGAKKIILTIDSKLMQVNSKEVTMDVAPIIAPQTNRTMVPVRFVSEHLGAQVQWLQETKQVRIVLGDTEILLTIGSNKVLVNGEEIEIDCPAEVYGFRTYVPLRFVSEVLRAKVDWDETTRQVMIFK